MSLYSMFYSKFYVIASIVTDTWRIIPDHPLCIPRSLNANFHPRADTSFKFDSNPPFLI